MENIFIMESSNKKNCLFVKLIKCGCRLFGGNESTKSTESTKSAESTESVAEKPTSKKSTSKKSKAKKSKAKKSKAKKR